MTPIQGGVAQGGIASLPQQGATGGAINPTMNTQAVGALGTMLGGMVQPSAGGQVQGPYGSGMQFPINSTNSTTTANMMQGGTGAPFGQVVGQLGMNQPGMGQMEKLMPFLPAKQPGSTPRNIDTLPADFSPNPASQQILERLYQSSPMMTPEQVANMPGPSLAHVGQPTPNQMAQFQTLQNMIQGMPAQRAPTNPLGQTVAQEIGSAASALGNLDRALGSGLMGGTPGQMGQPGMGQSFQPTPQQAALEAAREAARATLGPMQAFQFGDVAGLQQYLQSLSPEQQQAYQFLQQNQPQAEKAYQMGQPGMGQPVQFEQPGGGLSPTIQAANAFQQSAAGQQLMAQQSALSQQHQNLMMQLPAFKNLIELQNQIKASGMQPSAYQLQQLQNMQSQVDKEINASPAFQNLQSQAQALGNQYNSAFQQFQNPYLAQAQPNYVPGPSGPRRDNLPQNFFDRINARRNINAQNNFQNAAQSARERFGERMNLMNQLRSDVPAFQQMRELQKTFSDMYGKNPTQGQREEMQAQMRPFQEQLQTNPLYQRLQELRGGPRGGEFDRRVPDMDQQNFSGPARIDRRGFEDERRRGLASIPPAGYLPRGNTPNQRTGPRGDI